MKLYPGDGEDVRDGIPARQYDQRADSAAQCIQLDTGEVRGSPRQSNMLYGNISSEELERVKPTFGPVESE